MVKKISVILLDQTYLSKLLPICLNHFWEATYIWEWIDSPVFLEEYLATYPVGDLVITDAACLERVQEKGYYKNKLVLREGEAPLDSQDSSIFYVDKYASSEKILDRIAVALTEKKASTIPLFTLHTQGLDKRLEALLSFCQAHPTKKGFLILGHSLSCALDQDFPIFIGNMRDLHQACLEENLQFFQEQIFADWRGMGCLKSLQGLLEPLDLDFSYYNLAIRAVLDSHHYDYILLDLDFAMVLYLPKLGDLIKGHFIFEQGNSQYQNQLALVEDYLQGPKIAIGKQGFLPTLYL